MAATPNNLLTADAIGTIHLVGVDSAKPAPTVRNAGYLYTATDTGKWYRSDGTTWTAQASFPVDFGNDFLTGTALDGNDMGMVCYRSMIILGIKLRTDANPGQTLTVTVNKNGSGVASQSMSTGGVQTPSGFPVNCAVGDRLLISLTGTTGVTGLSYTVGADAINPVV
jgi:hypothetical protein